MLASTFSSVRFLNQHITLLPSCARFVQTGYRPTYQAPPEGTSACSPAPRLPQRLSSLTRLLDEHLPWIRSDELSSATEYPILAMPVRSEGWFLSPPYLLLYSWDQTMNQAILTSVWDSTNRMIIPNKCTMKSLRAYLLLFQGLSKQAAAIMIPIPTIKMSRRLSTPKLQGFLRNFFLNVRNHTFKDHLKPF